jgi:hypothetical protein
VIADVRDSIEREVYVKLAAKSLYLDEPQVRMALREHQSHTARAARESPFNDDARRRPALTPIANEGDAPVESRQKVLANALEAVLVRPELLDTADADALREEMSPEFQALLEAARDQWRATQRLDGAVLLEFCPTEKARAWVSARLVAGGERVMAPTLLDWGVLEAIAPADQLLPYALDFAERYVHKPPVAVQMIKQSVNQIVSALDQGLFHMDADQNLLTRQTDDHLEAVAAYRGKRQPRFSGD